MSHQNLTPRLALALAAALGLGLAFAAPAQAATISFTNVLMDASDGWRETDVTKPAGTDPNGDGALGSDGWFLTDGGSIDEQLPTFIGDVTEGTDIEGKFKGSTLNVTMDDPAETIDADVPNRDFGVFFTSDASDKEYFNVTLSEAATFQMGVILDGYTDIQQTDTVTVQTAGGSVSASSAVTGFNEDADFYVFEISGEAGDQFDVLLDGDSDQNSAGLTFEVIPEPATLALLGLGGAVMLTGRKRRA